MTELNGTEQTVKGNSESHCVHTQRERDTADIRTANTLCRLVVLNPFSVSIGDTSAFGKYTGRGAFVQVKKPITLKFQSLADQVPNANYEQNTQANSNTQLPSERTICDLCSPEYLCTQLRTPTLLLADFAKMDAPQQVLHGLQALAAFETKHNRFVSRFRQ